MLETTLLEDRRSELVAKGKRGEREKGDGKTRYEKRVKSRFASSTRYYNEINMDDLFKKNILSVIIPVNGETSDYKIKIKFGKVIDHIQRRVRDQNGTFDLRCIIRALNDAFNEDDVYIHCDCADFKYRFAYFCTVTGINSGEPQLIPSNETNPKNTLGPGCKHIMLVLSNTGWLIKVASVIMNWVKYMEKYRPKQYADIIYPKIYNKKYEEPVQLSLDDIGGDTLQTDKETLDVSNEMGRKRGQFKVGNKYRFQPKQNRTIKGQISLDDIDTEKE